MSRSGSGLFQINQNGQQEWHSCRKIYQNPKQCTNEGEIFWRDDCLRLSHIAACLVSKGTDSPCSSLFSRVLV